MKLRTRGHWVVKAAWIAVDDDSAGNIIIGLRRALYVYSRQLNQIIHRSRYLDAEASYAAFLGALVWLNLNGDKEMARWNPKPSLCFQREDFGTLIVVGKVLYQFDDKMQLKTTRERQTFFQAAQEVMFMIGALDITLAEPAQEEKGDSA